MESQSKHIYICLYTYNRPLYIRDKYSLMQFSNVRSINSRPKVIDMYFICMYSLLLCITYGRLLESQLVLVLS